MKRWFAVHRWLGWLLAPLLALSAATGAVLVWLQPLPVPPQRAPAVPAMATAIDRGLAELRTSHPELKLSYIDLPRDAGHPVRVRLVRSDGAGEELWAELDSASGARLALHGDGANLHAWLFNLHHELLLRDAGSWVLGGAALLALISLAVALRLWLRVRRLHAPTAWRRWHRRVGIAMLVPLLVTLATGFALSWPEAVRMPLTWATGQARPQPPVVAGADASMTPVSPGQALLNGVGPFPGAVPTRLYAPKSGTYRLRLRTDEWHPNGLNNVYVSLRGGHLAQVLPWRELPWSARYSNIVYPLHIAWLPGQAAPAAAILARVVWTATALALIWMVVSGVPWQTGRRKAAQRLRSSA